MSDRIGINITTDNTKAELERVTKSIVEIMHRGFTNHMDQSTIVVAINALSAIARVESVNIDSCNITTKGDKIVNMDSEDED